MPITSSRRGCLLDALEQAYRVLGFEDAAGRDDVFRDLVLARIIEPVSKLDSIRVLSKSDLQARPICHRKRDSIEAHLTIAFLAVSRWIEAQTGWSIRKFVKTARRYRTVQIQAGRQTITAADPVPDDLRQALHAAKAILSR
jgi:hypothetical protein